MLSWTFPVVLRETILTTLDSIETVSSVESEIVRVVSLSTTEITEITRFENTDLQGTDTFNEHTYQMRGIKIYVDHTNIYQLVK